VQLLVFDSMKGWGKFPVVKGKGLLKGTNRFSPYAGKGGKDGVKVEGSRSPDCKIFVGHLPYSTSWQDLKDHFASAGTVTYTKIIMDHAKAAGKGKGVPTANADGWSKGMGMVEFSSAEEAQAAIKLLNGSSIKERSISVEPWTSHDGPDPQKPAASPFKGAAKGAFKGAAKGGGKKGSQNPTCKVYVGQLPYSTTWQDLKDHFGQAGTVTYTKINVDQAKGWTKGKGANPDGWSKGTGIVEFSSPDEASAALTMLNGSTLGGRSIVVDKWLMD